MLKTIVGGPVIARGVTLPFSRAVRAGGLLWISGQLPMRDGALVDGDIEVQTHATFAALSAVLAEAGATLADVVKVTVWLTDAADFPAFNRVYATYFPTAPPARSTVRSDLVVPGARVEIEAVAACSDALASRE